MVRQEKKKQAVLVRLTTLIIIITLVDYNPSSSLQTSPVSTFMRGEAS